MMEDLDEQNYGSQERMEFDLLLVEMKERS